MEVYVVVSRRQFLDTHYVTVEAVFSVEALANEYVVRKIENDFDDRSWVVYKGVVDKEVENMKEATQ